MKKNWIISVVIFVIIASFAFLFFKYKKIDIKQLNTFIVVDENQRQEKKSRALCEKAMEYKQAVQDKEAQKVFREVIKNYPQLPSAAKAYYELALYSLKENKESSAIEYFNKIINDFPRDDQAGYAYYELAKIDEAKKNLLGAYDKYKKIKENFFHLDIISDVSDRLGKINIQIIFSSLQGPKSFLYTVKNGDSLFGIAKKFNTSIDFIIIANNFKEKVVLHPGDKIKVLDPNVVFSISVDKSQKALFLKMDGEIIKKYSIAIGRNNATPEGEFTIQNKLKDPVWFNSGEAIPADDPKNILGTRWIGFLNDIGVHGTTEDKEITQQSTSGCVRMYNKDVEELYCLVRIGDKVTVEA